MAREEEVLAAWPKTPVDIRIHGPGRGVNCRWAAAGGGEACHMRCMSAGAISDAAQDVLL